MFAWENKCCPSITFCLGLLEMYIFTFLFIPFSELFLATLLAAAGVRAGGLSEQGPGAPH